MKDIIIQKALEARKNSYCPYSKFAVGAALITEDHSIYSGCNIENASYGACNCAERTAIFKAVSEGHRKILAIAIAGGPKGQEPTDYAYPCGICRQVMWEFGDPDMKIYVVISPTQYEEYTLNELLAHGFKPETLNF